MAFITELFNRYGYFVLYAALALELIALPTPGETLMAYCGFLAFEGKLNFAECILVAATGVITGITISYFIGRALGKSFFVKYGSYIHMEPAKLDKLSKWSKKYGNGLLPAAYFIPGIRHITGYFSGVTGIPFIKFSVNAYIGAFLWTGTFITLGKVLGPDWERLHGPVKRYFIICIIIIITFLLCVYLFKRKK